MLEGMKEYESIEVMNNIERQLRQELKFWRRIRTPNSKASCNMRNSIHQSLELMTEYKDTESKARALNRKKLE
jgi:hypothetical protein